MRRKINKKEDEEGASKIFDGGGGAEMDVPGKKHTSILQNNIENQVS